MGILLIAIGSILTAAVFATIIGLTIGDIKSIHLQKALRDKARARRRRRQPLLSIIVHDNATDECVAAIKLSKYPKAEIIFSGERALGDLLLFMKRDTVLQPAAIIKAIEHFNMDPRLDALELLPVHGTPTSLANLFKIYHDIALAPFIPARAAFHAVPHWSRWPVMIRRDTKSNTLRLYISRLFRWCALTANTIALIYAVFLVIVALESFFLALYLCIFGFWMIFAISTYPYFSLSNKIKYCILAPVSFGYFFLLAIKAPFNPILRKLRRIVSQSFWQSYGHPTI